MKKYITIAALLVAGNVFVNAGTKATVELNTSNTTPVIATAELDAAAVKTILYGADLRSTLLGLTVVRNAGAENEAKYSWSIAANYWDTSNELHLYTKEAGESVSGNAQGSFGDPEMWPSAHKLSNTFGTEGDVASTILKGSLTLGYAGNHATMDLNGTAVVLSVLYSDGTIKSIYGINTGYKYSNDGMAYLTYNSDVLSAPTVTTGVDWTKDSLIAANVAAIPEPSAFGLLAGLGALALVGTRRRRK